MMYKFKSMIKFKNMDNLFSSETTFGVIALGALVLFGVFAFVRAVPPHDYWMNLFTELVSIVATVGVLNALARRRETQRWLEQMIANAGNPVQSVAVSSITTLRQNKYLYGDGSVLRKQQLPFADLSAVHLQNCNFNDTNFSNARLCNSHLQNTSLIGVNFSHADLTGSRLISANLREAELFQTNLQQAQLTYAQLNGAQLVEANLQECDLSGADLSGANLQGAILYGAMVVSVICDSHTTLPDGRKWNPQMSLESFTEHPDTTT